MRFDPPARAPREVRQLTWNELKSLSLLGEGGSCEVWSARLLGEPVAVKVVKQALVGSEAALADLTNESGLLRLFNHRNVVQLVGEGETADGRRFLALELLSSVLSAELPLPMVSVCGAPDEPDECSVCEYVAAARRWPLKRALLCALQLAHALRYLHEAAVPDTAVLHRDLKPDNVGFRHDGSLVLFDFGLATRWRKGAAAGGDGGRPLTGETGSLRYMSPEVALSVPYDSKADVFSFGTLLWQLCARQRPFRGLNQAPRPDPDPTPWLLA